MSDRQPTGPADHIIPTDQVILIVSEDGYQASNADLILVSTDEVDTSEPHVGKKIMLGGVEHMYVATYEACDGVDCGSAGLALIKA